MSTMFCQSCSLAMSIWLIYPKRSRTVTSFWGVKTGPGFALNVLKKHQSWYNQCHFVLPTPLARELLSIFSETEIMQNKYNYTMLLLFPLILFTALPDWFILVSGDPTIGVELSGEKKYLVPDVLANFATQLWQDYEQHMPASSWGQSY